MPRFLALDADAGGLFVAAGDVGRGGLVVEQTLAAADDLGPLTSANAAARGTRLKELLAAAAVKPAPLLLLVGRDRVIFKDVSHPPAAPADEPAVVRFQAARDLTDAADDVVMDYLPLPPAADGQRRATAVFLRKEVLAAARQLADAAGLKLVGITPRPFTAPAALRRAGVAPPAVVVTSWPGGGEFTAVADGRVWFTRPLTAADPVGEIRRNLAVYASQHPDAPLTTVLVADAGNLADRLAEVLPMPVRGIDPAAGVPGGDLLAPSLRGRLAGPLALLAQKAAADALPVNFAQPRVPRAEPGKNRGRLIIAAIAAALLLGMGGLFAYLQLDTAAARVAALQKQKKELQDQLDAVQPNVNRLKAADEFDAREAVVLDELYELARRVPDVSKLTVVEFELTSKPVLPTKKLGAATPATAGKAPPVPIATLRVTFRSADDKLVRGVMDSLTKDKQFYGKAALNVSPTSEAGNKAVQLVVTADVFRRKPDQYTQLIAAPRAAPVVAPAAADFGEGFAP